MASMNVGVTLHRNERQIAAGFCSRRCWFLQLNFGGRWGDRKEFYRFLQAYAVEKAKIEARRQGHLVTEQQLADGSIRVQIAVAG